jgi:MIP family channel proteins
MTDSIQALGKALAAEFIGTLLLIYIGCGTAVSTQALNSNQNTTLDNTFLVSVALAFGLAVSCMVFSIAPISGGHINPAVSFAFLILGDLSPANFLLYTVSQLLGALLGAALLWGSTASYSLEIMTGGDGNKLPPFYLGANRVLDILPIGSAFLAECMGTFILAWVVIMTAVHPKSIAANLAPIAIGWAVLIVHLVLVPTTTCSINPARTFGPQMIDLMAGAKLDYFRGSWIYYVAPFVGSGVAAVVTKFLFGVKESDVFGVTDGDETGLTAAEDNKKEEDKVETVVEKVDETP